MEKTKGERGVYRRGLGILSILVGVAIAILSGFNFYNVEYPVIGVVLATGTTLLGIGLIKDTKIAK
jgi:hypothetical protein